MEEMQTNIFVSTTLPQHFDKEIWLTIRQQPFQEFHATQRRLLQLLLKDTFLQQQYLPIFEENHLRLYHWYLLAAREQLEIEPYVFIPVLQRNLSIRQTGTSKPRSTFPHRTAKTSPNKIRTLFHTSPKYSAALPDKIDSHQLYLDTFSACQGERYTVYNYHRYLKKAGFQKDKYNSFIRQAKHKSNYLKPISSSNQQLSKFQQWHQIKQKSPLLCFRSVLTNSKLNNEAGLQSLLLRKTNKKIVFVNHQRKPVNYYLRLKSNINK